MYPIRNIVLMDHISNGNRKSLAKINYLLIGLKGKKGLVGRALLDFLKLR